jgi:3-oxoacyl-[acyl-carrier-protein] synthase-1
LSPNVEIMLMLTLPENFPGYVSDLNRDVLRELAALTGLNINLTESVVFTVGAAGGGLALAASIEKLKNIKMNTCVIMAGADSCIDLSLLAQLDKARRLANLDALDSFVPGEGACALLLSAEANPSSLGAVSCLENGIEDGHRFASDTAYRGDGLARTMSRSLTLYAGANKPAIIYSNLNGESFGLKELGVATIRNSQHLANPWRQEHPADGYGDQGGASFPLLIAIALANKAAPALVLCSSWGAERCCVLVEAPRA